MPYNPIIITPLTMMQPRQVSPSIYLILETERVADIDRVLLAFVTSHDSFHGGILSPNRKWNFGSDTKTSLLAGVEN
jgi:hypothetical protein